MAKRELGGCETSNRPGSSFVPDPSPYITWNMSPVEHDTCIIRVLSNTSQSRYRLYIQGGVTDERSLERRKNAFAEEEF